MSDTLMELHWGRVTRCYDRPPTLDAVFRKAVAGDPAMEAVVDGSNRLTYREIDRQVGRLAAALAARGIGKGDRVGVMLANRAEAVVTVLAVARIGAAVVLTGTRLRRPEIEYIVADSQAAALVYESQFEAELPARDPGPRPGMRSCVGTRSFETMFTTALVEDEALLGHYLEHVPIKRVAQPPEIAGAVLYLVSPAASYPTGVCPPVDGGYLVK